MKLKSYGAAGLVVGMAMMAGCGGGSHSSVMGMTTTVSGKVADGYLVNAQVFLDKNSNYQLDAGEPNTTTDATGSFTLTVQAADAGRYPIVVVAIKDQTIDLDTNTAVANTYVLSMHAVSVTGSTSNSTSGTVNNFISPVSTLLREILEANPGMTLAEAMTQVRNQLDMPADMNLLGDYIFGTYSGSHRSQYQRMHNTAREMAGMMGAQADLVMNGRVPDTGRYRSMMGQMADDLQTISFSVAQGDTATLHGMQETMRGSIGAMPRSTFRNYSTYFRNMTSHRSFWNMSGGMKMPKRHHGM